MAIDLLEKPAEMLGISQVRTDLSTALAGGFSLDESIQMNTFRVFSPGSPISVGPQFLPLNYPSARDWFAECHETIPFESLGVAGGALYACKCHPATGRANREFLPSEFS